MLRTLLHQMVSFDQCSCVCSSAVLLETGTQGLVGRGFFSLPHTVLRNFLRCSRKNEWQQPVETGHCLPGCMFTLLILSFCVACPFCLVYLCQQTGQRLVGGQLLAGRVSTQPAFPDFENWGGLTFAPGLELQLCDASTGGLNQNLSVLLWYSEQRLYAVVAFG